MYKPGVKFYQNKDISSFFFAIVTRKPTYKEKISLAFKQRVEKEVRNFVEVVHYKKDCHVGQSQLKIVKSKISASLCITVPTILLKVSTRELLWDVINECDVDPEKYDICVRKPAEMYYQNGDIIFEKLENGKLQIDFVDDGAKFIEFINKYFAEDKEEKNVFDSDSLEDEEDETLEECDTNSEVIY